MTVVGSLILTPVRTLALRPPGKVRSATAHSSIPVGPRVPRPVTVVGSSTGCPVAAPMIARAYETG